MRNSIRKHHAIAAILAGIVIVAGIGYVGWSTLGPTPTAGKDAQAFFTVDDGKTYFVDDTTKLPPFDHDGKTAVRAFVFTDKKAGDRRWVQYLQKFSDSEKQQMKGGADASHFLFGMVKKPGETAWITATQMAASEIMMPRSPNGATMDEVRLVNP